MRGSYRSFGFKRLGLSGCLMGLAIVSLLSAGSPASGMRDGRRSVHTVSREYAQGRELFQKIWVLGQASAPGGDGLGPLYNEVSCVGCHHIGGDGGAGGNDRNVTLLTAFAGPPRTENGLRIFKGELEDLHPGFRNHTSIVLHKFATSNADQTRLDDIRKYQTVQTRDDLVALAISQRNTPALFGAGLIDHVPDSVLLEAETREFKAFPEIKGRVSRLRDGRLGRFGWKGQTASLRDFVLAACSNELGLEVPGHHQASLVAAKDFKPSKIEPDLTDQEANLLVQFVAALPRPIVQPVESLMTSRGIAVFEQVGCATCHAPRLGHIAGLNSDLLLHDLGDRFRDSAGGYGMSLKSGQIVDRPTSKGSPAPPASGEAGPTEWRTAPLWGIADSAPYLHDGRAPTLDEAIRLHGGEAAKTSGRYAQLSSADRQSLLAFLHSLTSPMATRPHARPKAKRAR